MLKSTERDGEEPDEIDVWLLTHEPKKGSKLDDASLAANVKKGLRKSYPSFQKTQEISRNKMRSFKSLLEKTKNGYAETHGLGVKVPRSHKKRCELEAERAKRFKCEEEVKALCKDVKEQADKLDVLIDLVGKLAQQKGLLDDNENNGESRDEEDEEDEFEHEGGYEDMN